MRKIIQIAELYQLKNVTKTLYEPEYWTLNTHAIERSFSFGMATVRKWNETQKKKAKKDQVSNDESWFDTDKYELFPIH